MLIINSLKRTALISIAITTITFGNASAYVAYGVYHGNAYHRAGHVGGVHRGYHRPVYHRHWYNPRYW